MNIFPGENGRVLLAGWLAFMSQLPGTLEANPAAFIWSELQTWERQRNAQLSPRVGACRIH